MRFQELLSKEIKRKSFYMLNMAGPNIFLNL